MANTIVTPDQDAIISEVTIAAPPERVFQAITDPKQLVQWWTSEECRTHSFQCEPRCGGKWGFTTENTKFNINGVSQFHCQGEVIEYDPPRVLAYSWIANWHEEKDRRTIVRWELTPEGKGTRVKVTHSGLAQEGVARKDYTGGWPGVVEQLKKFLEN